MERKISTSSLRAIKTPDSNQIVPFSPRQKITTKKTLQFPSPIPIVSMSHQNRLTLTSASPSSRQDPHWTPIVKYRNKLQNARGSVTTSNRQKRSSSTAQGNWCNSIPERAWNEGNRNKIPISSIMFRPDKRTESESNIIKGKLDEYISTHRKSYFILF